MGLTEQNRGNVYNIVGSHMKSPVLFSPLCSQPVLRLFSYNDDQHCPSNASLSLACGPDGADSHRRSQGKHGRKCQNRERWLDLCRSWSQEHRGRLCSEAIKAAVLTELLDYRIGLEDLVGKRRMPRFVLARRPSLSRRFEQADYQLHRRDPQVDERKDRVGP